MSENSGPGGTGSYALAPQAPPKPSTADRSDYIGVDDYYRAWVGTERVPASQTDAHDRQSVEGIYRLPQYHNGDEYRLMPPQNDQRSIANLQANLIGMGFLNTNAVPRMGMFTGQAATATVAAFKQALHAANIQGVSFEQMVKSYQAAIGGGGPGSNGSNGPGRGRGPSGAGYGGTSTSSNSSIATQSQINLTSAENARAILRVALQQELGREPDEVELTAFTKALNRVEKENPDVSTTKSNSTQTTRVSGSAQNSKSSTTGTSNSSTTTKQGNVNSQEEALQYAKSGSLAAERSMFKNSQYMNVISQMLGIQ